LIGGYVTEIEIHPLAPEDHDDWVALWRDYLHFYETELPAEIYETTFDRLTSADDPERAAFVARVGGRIAGLVHFVFHAHNWRIEDTCYLQDLYTAPDMRGLGVGRALIEAVYAAADANGTPSVYWLTQDFNTPARRLYDRVGKLTPFIKYARP